MIGDPFDPGSTTDARRLGGSLHHSASYFSLDLSPMRRPHDHLGATQRRPDHFAFSTPSPREERMKRSLLFRASSRPSAPTLFVSRADPKVLTHRCPVVSYRGRSTLRSPLPPRFAARPMRLSRAPPSHPTQKTRFKSHRVAARLRSNGCIESAPSGPFRCSIAFSPARFRYSTNVYRAESVEVPTPPSFQVRYPGGISRRTWAPHLRFRD